MIYFTADLHFGHKNILSYDDREFPDIETNDRTIIERWNDTVAPDDSVWILGDVSWYGPKKTAEILSGLNGVKYLCIGNHDKRLLKSKEVREQFAEITPYKEIELWGGGGVVLCHYPIPCYNNHFRDWIHLYGHVHDGFEEKIMRRVQYEMRSLYGKPHRMINVGCMMPYMDYTPRSLEKLLYISDRDDSPAEGR